MKCTNVKAITNMDFHVNKVNKILRRMSINNTKNNNGVADLAFILSFKICDTTSLECNIYVYDL